MSTEAQVSAEELQAQWAAELAELAQQTAAAMNQARAGAIIPDSEEPVREAMARFRQKAYEKAVQLMTDKAAKAAFSPQRHPERRVRNKGPQSVEHLTGNGIIRITRRVYVCREKGRDDEVDHWLGIASASVTVGARELCCRVAMSGVSFEKARENLERLGQIRVSKERLRQIVEEEGKRVVEGRRAGRVRPDWGAKDCVVEGSGLTRMMTGADGVMVPVVTESEKKKRREGLAKKGWKQRALRRKGQDQGYKEFKIGTFYDESRQRQYAFGTSGDHQEFGRQLRQEAAKVRLDLADEKLGLADGARWIERQWDIRLPMLGAKILDFYHFSEHVGQTSREVFGEGQAGSEWTGGVLGLARTQGPAAVLMRVEETLRKTRSGGKRASLKGLQQYVSQRCHMMDYPTYLANGWDIGSGPTEAFCKTSTARLKGSGMRWDLQNAEGIMALAVLESSRLWKSYWDKELAAAA